MARYYFDTTTYGVEAPDTEGSELETLDEVSDLALGVLAEMMHLGSHPIKPGDFFVNVREETGRIIYQGKLSLAGEWLV
jgi:hypothetical protein